MASPLHPFLLYSSPTLFLLVLHSTLPIYFHLLYTLHSLRSPSNRQGCCGWHVSSWEQPSRVDGPQYSERRDSPTTQPSVCVFCFLSFFPPLCVCMCSCVCVLVYLSIVHLTEPTATPMAWISQYVKTLYVHVCQFFLSFVCVNFWEREVKGGISEALLLQNNRPLIRPAHYQRFISSFIQLLLSFTLFPSLSLPFSISPSLMPNKYSVTLKCWWNVNWRGEWEKVCVDLVLLLFWPSHNNYLRVCRHGVPDWQSNGCNGLWPLIIYEMRFRQERLMIHK